MSPALQAHVRERAGNRCEYCQLRQEDSPLAALHIEHILPRSHGGTDDLDNLALACIDCNLHKGTNLTIPKRMQLPSCFILADTIGANILSGEESISQGRLPSAEPRSEFLT